MCADSPDASMPSLLQRARPFRAEVDIEQKRCVGVAMEPAIGADLVLDLPRTPARIAEREERLARAFAFAHGAQDFDGRRQRNVFRNGKRGIRALIVAAVEHEAAAGFDGTAVEHRHVARLRLQLEFELVHQFAEPKPLDGAVDHDAHGAVQRMGAHEDHALFEARIGHARQRDEKFAFEEILAFDRARRRIALHVDIARVRGGGHFGGALCGRFARSGGFRTCHAPTITRRQARATRYSAYFVGACTRLRLLFPLCRGWVKSAAAGN